MEVTPAHGGHMVHPHMEVTHLLLLAAATADAEDAADLLLTSLLEDVEDAEGWG